MKKNLFLVLFMVLLAASCDARVRDFRAEALMVYSHDRGAYTQGLFFWNGGFYETTGQYGESSLRKVDLETGKVLTIKKFADKYFAEGACVVDGSLYVLTWKNRVAFVYDAATLKYEKTLAYNREGWGLTALPEGYDDKAVMLASDGSSNLYFLDGNLRTVRFVKVNIDGRPVRLLNELEWIDGKVWANVYTTDMIVIINPSDGKVEARVDCSDLFPVRKRTPGMDVLNGIAAGPDGSVYLTGKYWPSLFKVRLSDSEKRRP